MELFYGKIDKIGDSSKDEEKSRYQVRLDAEDIVTGWIFLSKPFTKDNILDYTLDLQQPVWCLLNDDHRTGIIGGGIVTKDVPQKETGADIIQVFFKDESFVKYDRANHVFDVFIKGDDAQVNITAEKGIVNLKCKNDFKIDSDSGKVIINGGSNKGMVILDDLVDKLNALEQDANTLKQAFATWVPVPMDGGAALYANALSWSAQMLVETQPADIEDTNAQH